jgi:hypothetical protein
MYLVRISQIHTLKLRNSPNPHNRVILDKLTLSQLVKTFPTIYDTSSPITFSITAPHFSPPCGKLMNTTRDYVISVWPILISSSHLRLGHQRCFSSACFATKIPPPLHTPKYTFQFTLLSSLLKMADIKGRNMLYRTNECAVFWVLPSVW